MAKKNQGGRPRFTPTPAQRELVESLAAYGIPHADICLLVKGPNGKPITEHTLRRHFRAELDTGSVKANAKVAGSLFKQATGSGRGAVTAAIFWLKTRAQWKETSVLEHGGPGGGALVIKISPDDDNL
jgi:hypothetical protein